MKKYKDYMSSINIDETAHNKIIRTVSQPKRKNSTRAVYLYAPAAICAVMILGGAFALPNILPRENPPISSPLSSGETSVSEAEELSESSQTDSEDFQVVEPENKTFPYIPNTYLSWEETNRLIYTKNINENDLRNLMGECYDEFVKNADYPDRLAAAFFNEMNMPNYISLNLLFKETGIIRVTIGDVNQSGHRYLYDYSNSDKITEPVNVNGVDVYYGYLHSESSYDEAEYSYYTYNVYFERGGIYYILTSNSDAGGFPDKTETAKEINRLTEILTESAVPDLSVIISDLTTERINKNLTFEEAKADDTFGKYIPSSVPSGITFNYAKRNKIIFPENTDTGLYTFFGGDADSLHLSFTGNSDGKINFIYSKRDEDYINSTFFSGVKLEDLKPEDIELMRFPDNVMFDGVVQNNQEIANEYMIIVHFEDIQIQVFYTGDNPEEAYDILKDIDVYDTLHP